MDNTRFALLFPCSSRLFSLTLLTVVREVSADEKKADKNNKITTVINCTIFWGCMSKMYVTPFCKNVMERILHYLLFYVKFIEISSYIFHKYLMVYLVGEKDIW